MDFLSTLWMPIVVSAVLVWIASFLTHMVLPHHKSEWKGLPNEEGTMSMLSGAAPGRYMFPFGTMEDWKSPEFEEKMKKGPVGIAVIWPGPVNMGMNMLITFLFYVFVGAFVAWLASQSLAPSDPYMTKFTYVAVASFMAHGLGWMPFLIWYKSGSFWPNLFDSILYALVTAGTFGWLMPKA